ILAIGAEAHILRGHRAAVAELSHYPMLCNNRPCLYIQCCCCQPMIDRHVLNIGLISPPITFHASRLDKRWLIDGFTGLHLSTSIPCGTLPPERPTGERLRSPTAGEWDSHRERGAYDVSHGLQTDRVGWSLSGHRHCPGDAGTIRWRFSPARGYRLSCSP